MKIVFVALGVLLATLSSVRVCAQSPMPAPPFGPTHIGGDERPDAPTKDDFRRQAMHPQRHVGPVPEKRILTKGLLAPSTQDLAASAIFLRQPDTGLMKLLPRAIPGQTDRTAKKRAKIRGGGAYYSFFNLTHDYSFGSDLQLDQNTLSVSSAGPIYGMLTDLGDVSLVDVSADDAHAAFMAAYKPASNAPDFRCEMQRFHDGVTMNGSRYNLSLPVKVNSTYLLRSINYFRSDLMVAFRITRQESDGSITILWKLLKQFWRPTFERVVYVNPVNKCPPQ